MKKGRKMHFVKQREEKVSCTKPRAREKACHDFLTTSLAFLQAFLQNILVAASLDTSESCLSQCQNQVSPWLTGPCTDAQAETLRYPCADRDFPPLATSWKPSEENQWIDSRKKRTTGW